MRNSGPKELRGERGGLALSLYLGTVTIALQGSHHLQLVRTASDENLDESLGTRLPLLALYPAHMDIHVCGLGTRPDHYIYSAYEPRAVKNYSRASRFCTCTCRCTMNHTVVALISCLCVPGKQNCYRDARSS